MKYEETDGGYEWCFFDREVLSCDLIGSVIVSVFTMAEVWELFSDTKCQCDSMIEEGTEPTGWLLVQRHSGNGSCSYTNGQFDRWIEDETWKTLRTDGSCYKWYSDEDLPEFAGI